MATYMRDSIVGIRRQMDRSKGADSLRRLLEEIALHPSIVSASRFATGYPEGLQTAARSEFEKLVRNHRTLPRASVRKDLQDLESAWESPGIKAVAHRRLAHAMPGQRAPGKLRWQDLHDCIGTLERICLRYRYLLTQQWDNGHLLSDVVLEELDEEISAFWDHPQGSGPGASRSP
jgi:hypothetical protein